MERLKKAIEVVKTFFIGARKVVIFLAWITVEAINFIVKAIVTLIGAAIPITIIAIAIHLIFFQ